MHLLVRALVKQAPLTPTDVAHPRMRVLAPATMDTYMYQLVSQVFHEETLLGGFWRGIRR